MKLYEVAEEYQTVLNALEESGADQQTIEDTLAIYKDDLKAKGRNVAAYFQNLDADIKAMKDAEGRIAARRKALENKSESLKDYLRFNMEQSGIEEISCPEFSVKLGKPSKVCEIYDDSKIPKKFKVEKVTISIDKNVIKKAINSGEEVEGARIVDGKSRLTIK